MPKFQLPRDPSSELIRLQLDVMKQAHIEAGPPSGEIRKDRIDRAIALLRAHAEAFCDAVSADFGNRSRLVADQPTGILFVAAESGRSHIGVGFSSARKQSSCRPYHHSA
jgi:hypothetical protein